ncbi:hypothetical protein Bbelb_391670 [Branchiostoma belcheri]|nr:hypothetical protein Bbelb_391670 [Branchiostoma belcheri]
MLATRKPPTNANTPTVPCALTSRLSAPFMSALAIKHHARLHYICQRPSERRKQAYGAMCAHARIVSALRARRANHASSAESGRRDVPEPLTINGICGSDASRPSVPFAVTSRLFALFVSHIRNEETDAMHTYFGNKSSAKCTLTSDGKASG